MLAINSQFSITRLPVGTEKNMCLAIFAETLYFLYFTELIYFISKNKMILPNHTLLDLVTPA